MSVWIVLAVIAVVVFGLAGLASRRRRGNTMETPMQKVDRKQYKADFGDRGRGR